MRYQPFTLATSVALGVLTLSLPALADDPDPPAAAAGPDAPATHDKGKKDEEKVEPPMGPQRARSLDPKPAAVAPPGRATFDIDPVVDGAITAVAFGFAGTADLINSTGEIRPQQISPTFKRSDLLWIDRIALSQTVDPHAPRNATIALAAGVAFAAIDPILSGLREHDVQSGIADAFLYAESLGITYALTNITKMAVRRPRPYAYIDAEAHKNDPNYSNTVTDSALSFFSGHAAIVAAVGSTATYLAFARSPHTARPWITLVLATALSAFTSYERVRGASHFPTDVIAATIAGAGVGILVPHLHRTSTVEQRRVWVGAAPAEIGHGGTVALGGRF